MSWKILEKGDDHFTFPSYEPEREIDFVLLQPAERFEVIGQRLIDEPISLGSSTLVVDSDHTASTCHTD